MQNKEDTLNVRLLVLIIRVMQWQRLSKKAKITLFCPHSPSSHYRYKHVWKKLSTYDRMHLIDCCISESWHGFHKEISLFLGSLCIVKLYLETWSQGYFCMWEIAQGKIYCQHLHWNRDHFIFSTLISKYSLTKRLEQKLKKSFIIGND